MKRLVLLLCAVAALPACSVLPQTNHATDTRTTEPLSALGDTSVIDRARSRLVVRDFVEAMVQLPELEPRQTTLYTSLPKSHFGALLISTMQDAGYDLRIGDGQQNGMLAYTIVPEAVNGDVSRAEYTFLISVASVKMKRRYRVDADGVYPATSMFLHGSDAGQLALNSTLFDQQSAQSIQHPSVSLAAVSSRPDQIRTASHEVTRTVAARGKGIQVAAIEPRKQPVRVSANEVAPSRVGIAKRNIFETRQSNYQEVLQQYEVLRKEVMIFPDDSLVMGRTNKATARDIAANFDASRDVLSLIGCSHGKSAITNGNERLANGRASRVKQEFTLAGIDAELVLEEGCWASTHFQAMPARGVVVTHRRRGPAAQS